MVYHIIAGLCALLLSMLGGYTLLPVLKKLRVGQTINELGPQNHMAKQGALTMGGVSFLAAGLLCSLAFGFRYKNDHGQLLLYCVLCTLSFGFVGFVDDYLKVVRHRSEGLTVKQKLLPQIVLAIVFAVIAYASDSIGSGIMLPFTSKRLDRAQGDHPRQSRLLVGLHQPRAGRAARRHVRAAERRRTRIRDHSVRHPRLDTALRYERPVAIVLYEALRQLHWPELSGKGQLHRLPTPEEKDWKDYI